MLLLAIQLNTVDVMTWLCMPAGFAMAWQLACDKSRGRSHSGAHLVALSFLAHVLIALCSLSCIRHKMLLSSLRASMNRDHTTPGLAIVAAVSAAAQKGEAAWDSVKSLLPQVINHRLGHVWWCCCLDGVVAQVQYTLHCGRFLIVFSSSSFLGQSKCVGILCFDRCSGCMHNSAATSQNYLHC